MRETKVLRLSFISKKEVSYFIILIEARKLSGLNRTKTFTSETCNTMEITINRIPHYDATKKNDTERLHNSGLNDSKNEKFQTVCVK